MLSWLGFGQKEKQSSTEENNNESVSVTEQESATELETNDNAVELTTEQQVEPTTTQEVTPANKVEIIEEVIDASIVEPITESITEVIIETATVDITQTQTQTSTEAELNDAVCDDVEPELADTAKDISQEAVTEVEAEEKLGFFARLKQGLSKTRQNLGGGLADLFRGKQIDDDLFEELETHLLLADVGVETTMKIIDSLTQSASRKQLKDASALYDLLKIELKKVIENVSQPLVIPEGEGPFVMLMVGVNGVGKTTTIGKLAKQFQAQGKSVMLAAGDTFRAAAVEQLQVWGERNNIPVIAQHTGADSASVIFDAISAAKARKVDVIIADTAGRLQNKAHLMEELKKVVRVMKKLDVNAPHEVMLTLDAGTGQNALSQTKLFDDAVGLTGLTITKLDGTAKGGVVFAIADKHNIPIRYLGVGEGIDDLRPFNGDDFIDAIFSN
ncbi:signal recognition particle-docking protein FtsY [Colwellia echini]|uniref:Signal recognition particle receptor FtsY n=2 Tax=Colwellia echini TaxID=1982103 RepID=A0ABY3MZQ5_9GAMM|nr:signal recognition particle-docking protein FtsY [Colwellia echini]